MRVKMEPVQTQTQHKLPALNIRIPLSDPTPDETTLVVFPPAAA